MVKKLKRSDGPPKHELGTPDPNVYKTTLDFGWPLTWITWEHSWNQAAGDDETELGRFQLINFVIHTLSHNPICRDSHHLRWWLPYWDCCDRAIGAAVIIDHRIWYSRSTNRSGVPRKVVYEEVSAKFLDDPDRHTSAPSIRLHLSSALSGGSPLRSM